MKLSRDSVRFRTFMRSVKPEVLGGFQVFGLRLVVEKRSHLAWVDLYLLFWSFHWKWERFDK